MSTRIILASALSLFAVGFGPNSFAQGNPATARANGEITTAAKKFLATLDEGQRTKVVLDFNDEAQRKRWSNFPTAMFKRAGLRIGDLTKPQRDAVLTL